MEKIADEKTDLARVLVGATDRVLRHLALEGDLQRQLEDARALEAGAKEREDALSRELTGVIRQLAALRKCTDLRDRVAELEGQATASRVSRGDAYLVQAGWSGIQGEVGLELLRAQDKYPDCVHLFDGTGGSGRQTYMEIAKHSCERAYREGRLTHAEVLEEEVAEALAETDQSKLRAELVQVSAMALKWIADIDLRRTDPVRALSPLWWVTPGFRPVAGAAWCTYSRCGLAGAFVDEESGAAVVCWGHAADVGAIRKRACPRGVHGAGPCHCGARACDCDACNGMRVSP